MRLVEFYRIARPDLIHVLLSSDELSFAPHAAVHSAFRGLNDSYSGGSCGVEKVIGIQGARYRQRGGMVNRLHFSRLVRCYRARRRVSQVGGRS